MLNLRQFTRRAFGDDLAAPVSALRSQINEPVGRMEYDGRA